jgi:hypothetical protein
MQFMGKTTKTQRQYGWLARLSKFDTAVHKRIKGTFGPADCDSPDGLTAAAAVGIRVHHTKAHKTSHNFGGFTGFTVEKLRRIKDCPFKAARGDVVTVSYTASIPRTQKTWELVDKPLTLGAKTCIAGLEIALIGCCKSDVLKITVPPMLGYGESGWEDLVPESATLVFQVTIDNVEQRKGGCPSDMLGTPDCVAWEKKHPYKPPPAPSGFDDDKAYQDDDQGTVTRRKSMPTDPPTPAPTDFFVGELYAAEYKTDTPTGAPTLRTHWPTPATPHPTSEPTTAFEKAVNAMDNGGSNDPNMELHLPTPWPTNAPTSPPTVKYVPTPAPTTARAPTKMPTARPTWWPTMQPTLRCPSGTYLGFCPDLTHESIWDKQIWKNYQLNAKDFTIASNGESDVDVESADNVDAPDNIAQCKEQCEASADCIGYTRKQRRCYSYTGIDDRCDESTCDPNGRVFKQSGCTSQYKLGKMCCKACPIGKYTGYDTEDLTCKSCESSSSVQTNLLCQKCPVAHFRPHMSAPINGWKVSDMKTISAHPCKPCMDGNYEDWLNKKCLHCPSGKFQSDTTYTDCAVCPSGKGNKAGALGSAKCTDLSQDDSTSDTSSYYPAKPLAPSRAIAQEDLSHTKWSKTKHVATPWTSTSFTKFSDESDDDDATTPGSVKTRAPTPQPTPKVTYGKSDHQINGADYSNDDYWVAEAGSTSADTRAPDKLHDTLGDEDDDGAHDSAAARAPANLPLRHGTGDEDDDGAHDFGDGPRPPTSRAVDSYHIV